MSDRNKLLHRLKIIGGHVKALEKMLEADAYCVDIVHQSMAVQKALKKLDQEIIREHLESCVVDQIKKGNPNDAINELINLYELQ